MAKRRRLAPAVEIDWERVIKRARYRSAHKVRWGCLNSQGVLFTMADFKRTKIPSSVIHKMVREGRLKLDDYGYYDYVIPTQKVKRRALGIDR